VWARRWAPGCCRGLGRPADIHILYTHAGDDQTKSSEGLGFVAAGRGDAAVEQYAATASTTTPRSIGRPRVEYETNDRAFWWAAAAVYPPAAHLRGATTARTPREPHKSRSGRCSGQREPQATTEGGGRARCALADVRWRVWGISDAGGGRIGRRRAHRPRQHDAGGNVPRCSSHAGCKVAHTHHS